ncbi:PrpF domain-containing protein, partial [Escherichia coli]
MKKIPCVMMRGGTSRGAFLLAEHLPEDQTQRDKILMAIMGSGNDLEIDGIGGGNPLTSKVAIISRSSDPRADVDYLFAQVIVHEQRVDTTPNCGNMLSGVGAFAIENGLIAATSPVTRVRIRNVNTGTFTEADVQTPNGVVEYEGSARIDGVPGTAAPVALTFLNAAGTKTGKVFPTDNQIDYFDDVPVTCIDMAMPVVIIPAEYLGKTGYELPTELDADKALL